MNRLRPHRPAPLLCLALCGLWLGVATVAVAQGAPAQRTAAAPAREMDPNTLVNAGLQVAQLVDAGRSGEVWDGASAVAKRSVSRQKFNDDLSAQRRPMGAVGARRWAAINRHTSPGTPALPAGTYANVEFDTRFAGNRAARELVSFRLDEDGTWRVSGYVLNVAR